MKSVTVDIIIKGIINEFNCYQTEWLTSHSDIEFAPKEEALIVQFLKDTADSFIDEYTD